MKNLQNKFKKDHAVMIYIDRWLKLYISTILM